MCALLYYTCLAVVLLQFNINMCKASEDDPLDSRFAYEAKLLEKMIRMENEVERMKIEMAASQANVITVLQNMTRILDNKTSELTLLQERVDMPMVAFNVYNPLDSSLDTNQIVIFQNILLNEGNGYDNVIGTFTAPATGLYYFTAHVCNNGGVGFYYNIILEHNIITASTKFNNVQSDCGTVTVITKVTKGNRVWIKCTSGNTSSQLSESSSNRRNSFIGVLLQK